MQLYLLTIIRGDVRRNVLKYYCNNNILNKIGYYFDSITALVNYSVANENLLKELISAIMIIYLHHIFLIEHYLSIIYRLMF